MDWETDGYKLDLLKRLYTYYGLPVTPAPGAPNAATIDNNDAKYSDFGDEMMFNALMELQEKLKLSATTTNQIRESGFDVPSKLFVLKKSVKFPDDLAFISEPYQRSMVELFIAENRRKEQRKSG